VRRRGGETAAPSHVVCLLVRDYRLELPMIWGRLPVALKRHANKYLLRGCTNGVFHDMGNTASTTPTLHETRTEANKDDSMPCWAGYECAGRSGLFLFGLGVRRILVFTPRAR